jgi:signal transduction histidine kinase
MDATTQVPPEREQLILIVDDISRNLQVLGSILGEHGYSVNVASHGQGALDSLAAQMPDLILLDIQMPDIDGLEVCRRLKSDATTRNIPVIFLTARTETDDIVRGFEAGAVDYITKPFVSAELLARVRTHLKMKQYSDLIVQQNRHLQELDNEKNEMLGIVAHDLKNPIASIQLMADLIEHKQGVVPPEQLQSYANDLGQATQKMMALIKNLLDIHHIESGKFILRLAPVDILPMVEHLAGEYRLRAEHKSLTLRVHHPEHLPMIHADETAVYQVLDNLVSNAVKYSPHGKSVTIECRADAAVVRFIVRDEGPGLSEEDQQKLFGKFARLSAQPTGGESSTGLGLSIVKRLVEQMHGVVRCESRLGEGAAFIVEFPISTEAFE